MSNIKEFTGDHDSFREFVSSRGNLVVVEFFAHWCNACRRLGQLLPVLAQDYPDITFLKVNIDNLKDITKEYSIVATPHIKLFDSDENGNISVLDSINGGHIPLIRSKIDEFIKK